LHTAGILPDGFKFPDLGAFQLFEQALASALKTYGEDHPAVARRRNNLASVLKDLGEPAVAADEI
jgi:hypothetical protein